MPEVEFEDPQGDANIVYNLDAAIAIYNTEGRLMHEMPLYCGQGRCGNTWSEYDVSPPLRCNESGGYVMEFQIADQDGNLSNVVEVVVEDIE